MFPQSIVSNPAILRSRTPNYNNPEQSFAMTKNKQDELLTNLEEAFFNTRQSLNRTPAVFKQGCSAADQDPQARHVTPSIYQLQLDCDADRTGSLA
jgi:hypothetical protein